MGASPATFSIGEGRAIDLEREFAEFRRLPVVLRVLLENVLRNRRTQGTVDLFTDWLSSGCSEAEIEFSPDRLLMHDTTCGPALVDIAGMRDAVAEKGGDPLALNPILQIDVSTDHSIAIDRFRDGNALAFNIAREAERNAERFRLTKWAESALSNFRVHPPGTGILHTINLEQLATVVRSDAKSGGWIHPETLIGTDSHTPMINGLGVLGWGVGGLEAEGVMFGIPVVMQLPKVFGVRLTGALPEGTLATDLALRITELLRRQDLDSAFVEFFGPGVSSLSVGDRSVVANMAPEYGAQTAYFPVDARTLDYLRMTGRSETLIALVEEYHRKSGLWFDPHAYPRYMRVLELDLSSVTVSIAGPRRPHDLLAPSEAATALAPLSAGKTPSSFARGHGSIAIASITSCTNTTDPRLTVAAGLLARKARERGLRPAPWVKTAFSPGSPAAALYLERAGLLDDLVAMGFSIVGYGCMACIGNTGPLEPDMERAVGDGLVATAVISGNRNFPGRVHPLIEAGFLASPPLVVAYAIAGTSAIDILSDSLGPDARGADVYLRDLWPSSAEIDAVTANAHDARDFGDAFRKATESRRWKELRAPTTAFFPWDEASTYLRRPRFTFGGEAGRLGTYDAYPLMVLGDDITTDHISPAGPIEPDSETGRYLIAHGEAPLDLNVHSSRRGNFESMVRGLFTNKSVVNHLADGLPPGSTVHAPTGEILPLHEAANRYAASGASCVVLAGQRYGQGSSRDWAAKGLALLGVRAVLASSFERIHRTNLIGMGILPLSLPEGVDVTRLGVRANDRIHVEANAGHLLSNREVPVAVLRHGKPIHAFTTIAEVKTDLEFRQLEIGGVVPLILARTLKASEPAMASSDQARAEPHGMHPNPGRI
jgi:aconitate hydratase